MTAHRARLYDDRLPEAMSAGSSTVASGPDRDRTCDLGIKSPLLYQLSYRPSSRV